MKRWLRRVGPWLPLGLFLLALWVLHHELRVIPYDSLVEYLRRLPESRIALAVVLTGVSFVLLTLYDRLGFAYTGQDLPYRRIALTAFIGFAFSNTVGHALITGAPIRFRLYSAWGISAEHITKIIAFGYLTFWVGFFALAGAVFTLFPHTLPAMAWIPVSSERPLGWVLLTTVGVFLAATATVRGSWSLRHWELRLPGPGLAVNQIVIAAADLVVAAGVLWALLPSLEGLPFLSFLGFFLLAQVAALLSQVPGGLGVLESVVLLLLKPYVESTAIAGALIAFRLVYYLLPLAAASALIALHELRRQRSLLRKAMGAVERWGPEVVPPALGATAFLGGAFLLFSGATPPDPSRFAWLHQRLPLALIELSHFLAGLLGAGLMILARGLQKRLLTAYHLTAGLVSAGIALSLLRGFDLYTAAALGTVLGVLLPCRGAFDRRASLQDTRWTPAWAVAAVLVLITTAWLTLLSFQHLESAEEAWWRFAVGAHAPRSLRAVAGGAAVLLLFAVSRRLRPARPRAEAAARDDFGRVEEIVRRCARASAHLALLGDKRLLFNEAGNGFVMYAVEGRSWISMGDPVASPEDATELAWRFRELAGREDGWTAFYRVEPAHRSRYIDLGLGLLELGEAARVPLRGFSLDDPARDAPRRAHREATRRGARLEVVPAGEVAPLLPELAAISEAWLAHHDGEATGFSRGYFEPRYLERLPVAVVREGKGITGYAALWPGGGREELAIDHLRFRPEARREVKDCEVKDFLLLELMLWASREGYRWFHLGIAPPEEPAGGEEGAVRHQLASLVHPPDGLGEDPRRSRAFRERLAPVWEPRYLAAPGGFALRRVVEDLAALLARAPRAVP